VTLRALGQWLGAIVAAVIRRPILTACFVLGLSVSSLLLVVGTGRIGMNTDTADMISDKLPWRIDFIEYRDSFPARDRNIVAVVDGPNSEASSRYARALAAALRAEPELFPSVFMEGEGEFFERNGLLYLPLDQLNALVDRLIEAQPLLGRLASDVTGAGVVNVLADSIELAGDSASATASERDRIFAEIAATLEAAAAGERRPVLWGGLIGVAADDSPRQLLLIRPAVDFTRVPARAAIERLRRIGDELEQELATGARLRLTGTVAMENEELSSIVQSASAAGIAALVMVIVVLLLTLRSLRLLIIAVVTLLAGLGLTAAFAGFTVGHLNLLSVAFAVLYVGLGVDFILHLLLRTKELLAAGAGLDTALEETARGVGGSLVICAVTTAVGFFAFIPTDFVGISELGLIAGSGMMISLIVSLTLLPALVRLFCRDLQQAPAGRRRLRSGRLPMPPPGVTCVVAAVIAVGACLMLPGLRFDGNPINLRDPSSESIRTLEDLAADGRAPLFNLAVLVPDAGAAEAMAAELATLPDVAQVRTTARLVPDDQEDKLFALEDLDLVMGPTLRDFMPGSGAPVRVVAALNRLVALLAQAPAGPAGPELLAAAQRWLAYVATLSPDDAEAAAAALDSDLLGNLVEQVGRLEQGLDARRFTLDDVPAALRDRWLNAAGQQLVEVVPAEDLSDDAAAARFVAEVRSIAPHATGLPVVYQEAAATVTRSFLLALFYAFVAVTGLLLLFLRSIRDTLLVLVPIGFAALVTAALSVALGLPLNFANIIALPLLVGVGVDSGIHMVHRMRTEPPADGSLLHTSTSRAVFASAVTTVASFGNLAFSTHVGMASMGQLLTLGMAMSLVSVLVVLPALIRLGKKK